MGTKEEMDLKIKKQSEKIVLILACIFGICCFVYVYKKNNINVNPCDCADLSSKAQIVGEWHLSESDQKKLIDCESVYTYSEEAYEACVNKIMHQ